MISSWSPKEHDNEAEAIVSHLAMNHDDEDIDLALKLAQVDMYTRRLRERARRKRVARDFRLVSLYFNAIKKEKEKPTTAAKKREFQKEKYWTCLLRLKICRFLTNVIFLFLW